MKLTKDMVNELATAQARLMDTLVVIADKHGLDRKELIMESTEAHLCAIAFTDFKNYTTTKSVLANIQRSDAKTVAQYIHEIAKHELTVDEIEELLNHDL